MAFRELTDTTMGILDAILDSTANRVPLMHFKYLVLGYDKVIDTPMETISASISRILPEYKNVVKFDANEKFGRCSYIAIETNDKIYKNADIIFKFTSDKPSFARIVYEREWNNILKTLNPS